MTIKSFGPGSNLAGPALAALRIMSALLFMAHGIQKFFGFPSIRYGIANPMSLMGVAGILEIVGGALLLIGLFTRPAAFVLAGQMAVAYFMAHASKGMYPIDNGGESAILFCFVFLLLAAAGPGPFSVDGVLGSRKAPAEL
ncbi:DoxX family protein [Sphingomonas sp.]|jgi:putative oxidoreductase|uniref:DoxX family protein n=1 Tax=Sphingomonas sp. TaxID=28214 RepID=UPI002EDB6F11